MRRGQREEGWIDEREIITKKVAKKEKEVGGKETG